MDREGRETAGVASLPLAPQTIAEVNQKYWAAFEEHFYARLNLLEWAPFQVVKIFKIGLHWVTVYRPSLSASNVHYWIKLTWQAAWHIANEVASTVRTEFTNCYARPV
jgi:hypothetical protein